MKKTERKFVAEPTHYEPPRMRVSFISTLGLLCVSGSDINDAGEEGDDIFGE